MVYCSFPITLHAQLNDIMNAMNLLPQFVNVMSTAVFLVTRLVSSRIRYIVCSFTSSTPFLSD